jgi:tRNA threonylcarbamoyladenosine biosynthesis protein TsaB
VVWGRGPGSFTGLRTACAVAQGIGFAHDLPLLGVDTLAACAQQASTRVSHQGPWVVALDARMGEVYVGRYGPGQWRCMSMGQYELLKPGEVLVGPHEWLCGNGHVSHSELRCSESRTVHALPTGKAMLQLAPDLLEMGEGQAAEMALPLYIRDKVALTTVERALNKQQS